MGNTHNMSEGFQAKSKSKYRAAELSFGEGLYNEVVASLYYSAFDSVCALLIVRNLGSRAKSHKAVTTFVNKDLVRTGTIPADLGVTYNYLANLRNDADYEPLFQATEDDARELLEEVKRFNLFLDSLIQKEKSDLDKMDSFD